jgi:hypothetical protein
MYIVKLRDGNLSIVNSTLNIPQYITIPTLLKLDFINKKIEYDKVKNIFLKKKNDKHIELLVEIDFLFKLSSVKIIDKDENKGYIYIYFKFTPTKTFEENKSLYEDIYIKELNLIDNSKNNIIKNILHDIILFKNGKLFKDNFENTYLVIFDLENEYNSFINSKFIYFDIRYSKRPFIAEQNISFYKRINEFLDTNSVIDFVNKLNNYREKDYINEVNLYKYGSLGGFKTRASIIYDIRIDDIRNSILKYKEFDKIKDNTKFIDTYIRHKYFEIKYYLLQDKVYNDNINKNSNNREFDNVGSTQLMKNEFILTSKYFVKSDTINQIQITI